MNANGGERNVSVTNLRVLDRDVVTHVDSIFTDLSLIPISVYTYDTHPCLMEIE